MNWSDFKHKTFAEVDCHLKAVKGEVDLTKVSTYLPNILL